MADIQKFTVNSRFPLIGRVGQNSGTVTLAAGTYAAQEGRQVTGNIAVEASSITNISIELNGAVYPCSNYFNTDLQNGWTTEIYGEQTSETNVRVVVYLKNELDSSRYHAAITATVRVDAFNVP